MKTKCSHDSNGVVLESNKWRWQCKFNSSLNVRTHFTYNRFTRRRQKRETHSQWCEIRIGIRLAVWHFLFSAFYTTRSQLARICNSTCFPCLAWRRECSFLLSSLSSSFFLRVLTFFSLSLSLSLLSRLFAVIYLSKSVKKTIMIGRMNDWMSVWMNERTNVCSAVK